MLFPSETVAGRHSRITLQQHCNLLPKGTREAIAQSLNNIVLYCVEKNIKTDLHIFSALNSKLIILFFKFITHLTAIFVRENLTPQSTSISKYAISVWVYPDPHYNRKKTKPIRNYMH